MTRPVTSVTSKEEQVFDRTHLAGFIKNMSQYIEDAKAELKKIKLTLRRPLRRKVQMSWFFKVSKVKYSCFNKKCLPRLFKVILGQNSEKCQNMAND